MEVWRWVYFCARRKMPGSTGAKRSFEITMPESSRKFITCLRKYLLFYLHLCEKTFDIGTLEKAYYSLRVDKKVRADSFVDNVILWPHSQEKGNPRSEIMSHLVFWINSCSFYNSSFLTMWHWIIQGLALQFSLCLADMVQIALGKYIHTLGAAIVQFDTVGSVSNLSLKNLLERFFNLFMEHGGSWSDVVAVSLAEAGMSSAAAVSESVIYRYTSQSTGYINCPEKSTFHFYICCVPFYLIHFLSLLQSKLPEHWLISVIFTLIMGWSPSLLFC